MPGRRARIRTDPGLARAFVEETGVDALAVSIGAVLKQAYLAALAGALSRYRFPMSPHEFLGMGGSSDILVAAREAVKTKAKELLVLSGSAERAGNQNGPRCLPPMVPNRER